MARVRTSSGATSAEGLTREATSSRRAEAREPAEATGALVPRRTEAPVPVRRPAKTKKAARAPEPPPVRRPLPPAVKQAGWFAALAACGFMVLALSTWNAADPSLSVASSGAVANAGGALGAILADMAYQLVGWGAWSVLVVALTCVLRLAGRPVGGWLSTVVGAIGLVASCGLLELGLGGGAPAFPPGGLLGVVLGRTLSGPLGPVGVWLVLGTTVLISVSVLLGINWQPLVARAVEGVERGAPLAARAVGSAGVGVLRRTVGAGAAGIRGVQARFAETGETIDEEDLVDEGIVDPPTTAPPTRATASPAHPVEPPSVWSARRAPPGAVVSPVEPDPPTRVAGRTLVEVELDPTVAPRVAATVPPAAVPPVAASVAAPPRRPDPTPDLAPRPAPAPTAASPAPVPAPAPAPSRPDELDAEEVEDETIPPAPAPPRARTGSASDAAVLPGNLVSGGRTDDGRAVRALRSPFRLPPLSLLDEHPAIVAGTDEGALHELARKLCAKLLDFGVEGRVSAIRPGPVITLFEYEPAPGVKLSRIASLSDDLAMALKALSVRIVAPIPGRGVVGIEIPNERRQTVWARDLFASGEYRDGRHILPVILGKDTEGRPFVTDLAKMPHLLIGGTTGSGKSVGVNGMLCSLLFQRTPEELRLILVDPKMLEFELYQEIPHLLHPVVTEPKLASAVLKWACLEMDERYRLLARWQTRNIEGYNQKVDAELQDWTPEKARRYAPKDWPEGELLPYPKKLPYIVVVIDELADLMMVAARDVEESIVRIAQKARACGIHLIVATQRPSVDVITGLIKANMPSRLAYQVRSKTDGRTILDQNGAETLLGKGDLLYLPPGTSGLLRIHGPFLADEEVRRVADFCREQGPPEYAPRVTLDDVGGDDEDLSEEMDENYDRAVAFALEKGRISTSMIQRLLKIGYNRAARIMEIMEREGIVGPADGAKPREVLVQE